MRILLIMDPGILIPVSGYGGIERLIDLYAQEYKRQGHQVELLITAGSKVDGCLVHPFGKPGFPPTKADGLLAIPTAWKFLLSNYIRFDLIHNFGRLAYLIPVLNKPVNKIMTYQREITAHNIQILTSLPHKNLYFTGCSADLLTRGYLPGKWKAIHNGIDFSQYDCTTNLPKSAPLIFLGRIEKIKGCHTAIEVAKATNNKLIIAGNISTLPEEKKYFEEQIKPLIDGEQIRYIGTVNDQQKNEWLGKSKAMLMPIEWNEPFGIVMPEAMACGTPVIGFCRGSIAEVIDEGITGFKVNDKQGMIEALEKLPGLDRSICRQRAVERFSVQKIAGEYLMLAKQLLPENKIVLITTTQPAINPRLVKEATTLAEQGYGVTVLYSHKIAWAEAADKKIISEAQWEAVLIGGSPTRQQLIFFWTKIRARFFKWLNQLGFEKYGVAENTEVSCYAKMLFRAKKIKAAFYIGHNLGSLAVAVKAATYNKSKSGFDYEDYHRHEYAIDNSIRAKRIIFLEEKYIPDVDYLSFSSEPIQQQFLNDFPTFKKPNIVLQNCFSINELSADIRKSGKELKLFWFSQTVGPNRGLECLFEALLILHDKDISLTVAGRMREDVAQLYPKFAEKITGEVVFTGILKPHELHKLAEQHDVGLALEPGFSMNNDLALSNKIFTYLLAGNAIIFSETTAQKLFNDTNRAGQSFTPGNARHLADCINYYKDAMKLEEQKKHNLQLAKDKFNWEKESEKLLNLFK